MVSVETISYDFLCLLFYHVIYTSVHTHTSINTDLVIEAILLMRFELLLCD